MRAITRLAVTVILLTNCDRTERVAATIATVGTITTHDSAGVSITVVPGTLVTGAPRWETSARPVLTLGGPSDAGPSQFSRISGVRLLPHGQLMFSTDATKQVFTVDSAGTTVETRGRQGRGPFEFFHLQMLKSIDTNAVALFDALLRQVTLISTPRSEPAVVSLASLGLAAVIPIARFTSGELLARRPGLRPTASDRGVVHGVDSLERLDAQGHLIARYGAHAADDRVLRLNANGGLAGGRPPYSRQLLVDADDSTVVVAATGGWEMSLFDARGGDHRIVRVDLPRRPVDATMRRLYRERVLRDVRDEYGKREWTMLSDDDVFLPELPAFDLLLVDREGAIWLRETVTLADTDAGWNIFDRAGAPIARVSLPAAFTPFDISRDRIAGVWLDELGREQVQVWALSRR